MPAWTFVATAHAAVSAGLVPYFLDVEPSTWTLDPCALSKEIGRAPGPVGAVMVVMPFGQRIDFEAWEEFRRRTGVPVVIDAAAAFDSLQVREIPAVVSLHATKIIGVGEGGFVVSRDQSIIRDVRMRSNFGFDSNRNVMSAATNAKLSEYSAAVGLASLDAWSKTRVRWSAVAQRYREELAKSNQIQLQNGYGDSWVSATCVVTVPEHVHGAAQRALANAGVETRSWWGRGAHSYPATVKFPHAAELTVTERLANSTIGLPCYQDLQQGEIRKIAETLVAAVSS
jgi:dTDP-4-amino-4,6-dideoxygalactose transaminase